MLRLSNRGRYALRAVFDLALHGEAPVQVRDVATRQRIPLRFLEQICQLLKRGGLVDAKRGRGGGFTLAREPDEMRLGDVLRAVEGPVVLAEKTAARRPRRAAKRDKSDKRDEVDARDVTDAVLADLSRSVEQCFDGITVQDLCARGERVALAARARTASTPYVI